MFYLLAQVFVDSSHASSVRSPPYANALCTEESVYAQGSPLSHRTKKPLGEDSPPIQTQPTNTRLAPYARPALSEASPQSASGACIPNEIVSHRLVTSNPSTSHHALRTTPAALKQARTETPLQIARAPDVYPRFCDSAAQTGCGRSVRFAGPERRMNSQVALRW